MDIWDVFFVTGAGLVIWAACLFDHRVGMALGGLFAMYVGIRGATWASFNKSSKVGQSRGTEPSP